MVTPDGMWRVEAIRTRAGEVFRVRRGTVIGVHGGRGWAPTGQIRTGVAIGPSPLSSRQVIVGFRMPGCVTRSWTPADDR
jgi:hypothetical protein